MAKTSESVGVLVRHFLWQCISLPLLPVLFVVELFRSVRGFVKRRFRDQ